MFFSPPVQDECDIGDTNIITLINYRRRNDYGNCHRLIISHNLFQINVYDLQTGWKFYQNPSGRVQLFGAQFLRRTFQLFHASSAVHEWNHSTVPWPQAVQISENNNGLLHMSRQICGEKQSNLRTSKCAYYRTILFHLAVMMMPDFTVLLSCK